MSYEYSRDYSAYVEMANDICNGRFNYFHNGEMRSPNEDALYARLEDEGYDPYILRGEVELVLDRRY